MGYGRGNYLFLTSSKGFASFRGRLPGHGRCNVLAPAEVLPAIKPFRQNNFQHFGSNGYPWIMGIPKKRALS